MKNLLKKMLPALALTLMIGGTVVVSNATSVKKQTIDQWYGLPTSNPTNRIPLDQKPDDLDCDQSNNPCSVHVTDAGEQYFPGGLYTGQ
jgi:hypothetical protein